MDRGAGAGEVRVRSPRTCTWKHSSRKCKHLRERDGEVVSGTPKRGARAQADTQSESETGGRIEPRAHGRTARQGGQPRASAYRQVQAEGAEYIAGRGGGGGS